MPAVRALLLVALTLVYAFAPLAFAASPLTRAQKAEINRLVELAIEQRQTDPQAALTTLNKALGIGLEPAVLVSLGRVYEDLERYGEARTQYQNCLTDGVPADVQAAARKGLARLDVLQATGKLHIRVSPLGASLTIDGMLTALNAHGLVVLTPGVHRIALSHAGYEQHAQDMNIVGGTTASVVVNLAKTPEVITIVEPQTVQPVDFGAWPWVALGTGAALAGVGTYLVIDGAQDFNDEEGLPKAEAEALIEQGRTKQTVGYVGIGVGGALIGTAIILFLLESPGSAPASEGGARLELGPLPGGANATLTWDF
jgi:hypothetical protein